MTIKRLKIISVFISVIFLLLIGVQVYWVRNAVRLQQEQFGEHVSAALENTRKKLEKLEMLNHINRSPGGKSLIYPILSEKDFLLQFPEYIDSLTREQYGINDDSIGSMFIIKNMIDSDNSGTVNEEVIIGNPGSMQKKLSIQISSEHLIQKSNKNIDSIKKTVQLQVKALKDLMIEIVDLNLNKGEEFKIEGEVLNKILKEELAKTNINIPFESGVFSPTGRAVYHSGSDTNATRFSPFGIDLYPNDIIKKSYTLRVWFPHMRKYNIDSFGISVGISLVLLLAIIFLIFYTLASFIRQKRITEIRNDFVNNMTHELKTPLSSISLACEAINDESIVQNKGKRSIFIKVIQEESERLTNLVDLVLQNALLDNTEFKLSREPMDINDLAERLKTKVDVFAKKSNARIEWNCDLKDQKFYGDSVHLLNAFLNIIDNGIKYSPDIPWLTISFTEDENRLIFLFTDHGIGIPREEQKRIYDKFYRVPSGNLHDVKGFGLGLNYVKKVVNGHHGTISLESEPGKGSTFTITLPKQ